MNDFIHLLIIADRGAWLWICFLLIILIAVLKRICTGE